MKKILILLITMFLITGLVAITNEEVTTYFNSVEYSYQLTRNNDIPERISKTFALPATEAELFIHSAVLTKYDQAGNVVESTRNIGEDIVTLSHSFQMREMYGFTVDISVSQNLRSGYQVLEAVNFEVRATNTIELPTHVSEAFIGSYQKLADNFADSYLATLPLSRPKMLLVNSSSNLETFMNVYKRWKQASGFEVGVITKEASWTTASIVKQQISEYYEIHKPDYILILGDTSGSFAIPTNFYVSPDGTENDADDNYYTLLEGDENDYFPDVMIGRFSIGDPLSLGTQVSKTIKYERDLEIGPDADTDWMSRALVVAGNYAENNLQPSTPKRMSFWVSEQFYQNGYTEVDTVYYPPTYPGTSAISSSINSGVQYVSYRGWGDANGWHYPHFHIGNLSETNNVNKPSIVYSIVCNTGDFANSVNPSFGEYWMRMGSPANPKGCVAFVGPSDLHTKTKYNNAISTGMFNSFLNNNNRIFSTTVLDGKIELYKNYPLDREPGDYVPFYFHVYNMLNDPSLKMWVLEPNNMIVEGIPYSLDKGTSYLELDFPQGLNNAIVTTTKDEINYEYIRVKNGRAIVPINTESEGDQVTLTVTKVNYKPFVANIPISSNNNISVTQSSVTSGILQPGYSADLTLELKNYGSNYTNVEAELSSNNPHVVINDNLQNVGDMSAEATASLTYSVEISEDADFADVVDFDLYLTPSDNHEKFSKTLTGGFVEYITHNGQMIVGDSNQLQVTFRNIGNVDLAAGQVRVRALHSSVVNNDITVDYTSAVVNNTTIVNFSPEIDGLATPGTQIPFRFDFTEDLTGYSFTQHVILTISGVEPSHPTGPDNYGYYAYGSNDTSYSSAPEYNWIDIDPQEGGQGELTIVGDDDSFVTDLPFSFQYYGEEFNQVTICSNGWMSFGDTWYVNFTNSAIPSALGPKYQLCPNWDDLKGLQTSQGIFDDMRVSTYHDETNNRFIIEWNDTYTQSTIDQFENADLQKFQVILEPIANEDGDIIFQYHTFTNPSATSNYATIGIMNGERNDGIQYTFANLYPESAQAVDSEFAIKFTKTPPDSFVSNDNNVQIPQTYLKQNYPNPFNPETNITFALKESTKNVELAIYNVKGQLVKTLIKGALEAGSHSFVWNGKNNQDQDVASGIYYYKLSTENQNLTKKMILMK